MADNELHLSIDIDAPLDRVWHELIQWEKQSLWMLATKVWITSQQREGVGTSIAAFTGLAARRYPLMKYFGVLDEMRVTGWEKNESNAQCDVLHFGKIIRGTGTFRLTSTSESSTQFDWSEVVIAPRPLFALIKPFTLLGVYISLTRFARSLRTL